MLANRLYRLCEVCLSVVLFLGAGSAWAQTVVAPQTIVRVPGFLPDTDKYSMSQDNYAFVWAKETLVTLDGGQQQITYNPIAREWALSIPQDTNGNRIQDEGEDWSEVKPEYGAGVWQFRKDLSCWAATANNLAQTITGINYYYQWMYDDGVGTLMSIGRPNYWYSDGDQPHECLDAEDLANDTEYAENMLNGFWMSNPEYYLWRHLDGGKPVAASVEWDLFQGHAFTVYGIDTIDHRLWIVNSDDDANGDEPYWMDYRWHESGSGGFFQINWGGEWFDMNTFCSFETNKWGGYDDNFSTTSNWNGYPDWDVWEINGGGEVHVRGNESRPKRLVVQGIDQNLVIDTTGTLNLKTFMLSGEAQLDIYGRMNVIHQQTIDGVVNMYDGGVLDNTVGTTVVAAQQDGLVDQWGGEATIWKLVLAHERNNQYFELNRGYYNVLGGTLNVGEVIVGYEGWGELGLKPGTQLLRNTAAYAGEMRPEYLPDNSYITLGLGKQAHGNLYMDPNSTLETNRLVVGSLGTGYFEQRGGVATILGDLIVGEDAWFDNDWNLLRSYGQVKLLGDSLLYTTRTVVGERGRGWFLQDGTSVHDSDELIIGHLTKDGLASIGLYDMKSGTLGAGRLVIGSIGDGLFRQTGGQTIAGEVIVGQWSGEGQLALSGGSLSADSLHLKQGTLELLGTGGVIVNGESLLGQSATQDDESVFVTQSLSLSSYSGKYTLNDGRLSVVQDEVIDDIGGFSQSGGEHTVGGTLNVQGGLAWYDLKGGSLQADHAIVGNDGTGTFTQTGGTADFSQSLVLGENSSGLGSYDISAGTMHAGTLVIGHQGTGHFTQTGGTVHIAGALEIGINSGITGDYSFEGGTLIADTLDLNTRGDFITNGQGTLRLNEAHLNNVDGIALRGLSVQKLQIGHDGRDYDTTFALGMGQNITAEEVMIGYDLVGHVTNVQMDDFSKINATRMFLGYEPDTKGCVTINETGNQFNSDDLYVGYKGEGDVFQSAGTVRAYDTMHVGHLAGSTGYYTLSGGAIFTRDLTVGGMGEGMMTQSGGTNTISGSLSIGHGSSGNGWYILEGGTLNVVEVFVGNNGGEGHLLIGPTGTFNAESIVVSTNGRIDINRDWSMSKTLEIAGGDLVMDTDCLLELAKSSTTTFSAGNIVADNLSVGGGSPTVMTAKFQQTGGDVYVSHELTVGPTGYNNGLYTMSGGEMTAEDFIVANRAVATMEQSGGSVVATRQVVVGRYTDGEGDYTLSGGSLQTPKLQVGGQGTGVFQWTGGDLSVDEVQIRSLSEMNVGVDWMFSGWLRVQGGKLSLGEHTLTLQTSDDDFENPTRMNVATGSQVSGEELIINPLSEYIQAGGHATFGRVSIDTGLADIQGGTLECNELVVAPDNVQNGFWFTGNYRQSGGVANVNEFVMAAGANRFGLAELEGTGVLNTTNTRIGVEGLGDFRQYGGSHVVAQTLSVGESYGVEDTNRYVLSDGELTTNRTNVGTQGWGEFQQYGGVHRITTALYLGPQGVDLGHQARGSYRLLDGRLEAPMIHIEGNVQSHSHAELDLMGGELVTQEIRVGQYGGLWIGDDRTLQNVSLDVSGGGSVNHDYSLTLAGSNVSFRDGEWYGDTLRVESADFAGYGYVELWGSLHNAGQVIADGYGENQILDMSFVAGVTRPEENTGHFGWFARNQGSLILPSVTLGGDGTYTFGDDPSAGSLTLVNSVQMTLHGLSLAGDNTCLVTLLSPDDVSLPETNMHFIGMWDFSLPEGSSFDSADLLFRYDEVLAGQFGMVESDLRLYHYDGLAWEDVTSQLDVLNHTILAQGVDSFSYYAFGTVPEPATLGVLSLGGLALLLRKRN